MGMSRVDYRNSILGRSFRRHQHIDGSSPGQNAKKTSLLGPSAPPTEKTARKASPKDRSQQEARRARARENALMQLYNKGRPKGLGWSMNSLRGSLQLCSIENTGWAAKEDILNVLMAAGVSKRDSDVLLSTSHSQKSSSWCMYWPEVMRFLEEGPTTRPNESLTAKVPSAELDEASRGRESYERVEIDTLKNPANSELDNICNIPSEVKSSQNHQSPALDREHVALHHGGIDFTSERRENEGGILEQKSTVSTSRDQLEQSLLELENSVRMTEFGEGTVVPYQRLTEIIKKVRAVLRVAAVDDDIPSSPGNGKNATTTTTKTTVRSEGRSIADDGPKRLTSIEVDSPKDSPVGSTLAVDGKSTSLKDIKEAESLAAEACAAGKRGDIDALENLSRVVDLRRTDAFGRNALYYACLCGHVDAVQYVVDGTYGDVQGIPNDERWECSKSALTEEIRRYLNGGYVARNRLEGPPTARPGIETVTTIQQSDTKKTVEPGQPPSTPKDVVSIASLFEWGDGSDY